MENPELTTQGTGQNSTGGAKHTLAGLRARLAKAAPTKRSAWAETWLTWAEAAEPPRRQAYLTLVDARITAGLDDRPEPQEPMPPSRPAQSTPTPKKSDPRSYRARVHARMRGWHDGGT